MMKTLELLPQPDDDNSSQEDVQEPKDGLLKTLLRTVPNEGQSMGV